MTHKDVIAKNTAERIEAHRHPIPCYHERYHRGRTRKAEAFGVNQ